MPIQSAHLLVQELSHAALRSSGTAESAKSRHTPALPSHVAACAAASCSPEMSQACCSDALSQVAFTRDKDGALVARIALLAAPAVEPEEPEVQRSASAASSDADGDLELPRRPAPCEGAPTQRRRRIRAAGAEAAAHSASPALRGVVAAGRVRAAGVARRAFAGGLRPQLRCASHGACVGAHARLSCHTTPPERLDGATVLELGAGTGLVGLLAARRAAQVLLTDTGDEVLRNCAANVAACPRARVRRLDWAAEPPWTRRVTQPGAFGWSEADLEDLRRTSVVLVADCVYDDDLTDALWRTLQALFALCPHLHAVVSVERRVNFSAADMTGASIGYAFSYALPDALYSCSACTRLRPFPSKVLRAGRDASGAVFCAGRAPHRRRRRAAAVVVRARA